MAKLKDWLDGDDDEIGGGVKGANAAAAAAGEAEGGDAPAAELEQLQVSGEVSCAALHAAWHARHRSVESYSQPFLLCSLPFLLCSLPSCCPHLACAALSCSACGCAVLRELQEQSRSLDAAADEQAGAEEAASSSGRSFHKSALSALGALAGGMMFGLDDQLPKFEQAARDLVHPLFEKLKTEVRRCAVPCRVVPCCGKAEQSSFKGVLSLLCLHAMKCVTYVLLPAAVSCSGLVMTEPNACG